MVQVTKKAPQSTERAKFRRTKKTGRGEAGEAWEEDAGKWPLPTVEKEHTSRLGVTLGFSMQPRQFENIKGEVYLGIACDPDKVGSTYQRMVDWVDGRVAEMYVKAKENG